MVDGVPATVAYARAAPGNVAGFAQVNVQIPPNTVPGDAVPIRLTIGGASTPDGVSIAVR